MNVKYGDSGRDVVSGWPECRLRADALSAADRRYARDDTLAMVSRLLVGVYLDALTCRSSLAHQAPVEAASLIS